MAITHTKVSAVADGGDTDLVRPVDWNAAHTGQPTSISDFLEGTPTEDLATKAPTSEWAFDHNASSQISSKVKSETRDMEAASGDVSYTGYGFQPTSLECFAVLAGSPAGSWGFTDLAGDEFVTLQDYDSNMTVAPGYIIWLRPAAGKSQQATWKSYDANGFTLTWTKTGTPAAGTGGLFFRAVR